jgi:transposase
MSEKKQVVPGRNGMTPSEKPSPEVVPKAQRRRFNAGYKLRILSEVDSCEKRGDVGALLRREGLYSSLVSDWRKQRDEGSLEALTPKKRGPKPNPEAKKIAKLEQEVVRLRRELNQAQTIIAVQKKLADLLKSFEEDETGASS